jgi:hypothetical protein
VGGHRINVNALAPTFTRTPQVARRGSDFYRNLVARIPMGRIAETDDIVEPWFFVSPASDFITGQTRTSTAASPRRSRSQVPRCQGARGARVPRVPPAFVSGLSEVSHSWPEGSSI